MINEIEKTNSKTIERLNELLGYVRHLGILNQKPVFRIDEYKQLNIWEHELKGKIGIQHNIVDTDGISIWLRIERLKRIAPPTLPEHVKEWVSIGNDPESNPQIKDKLIKTLPEAEANQLVSDGVVAEKDVVEPLNERIADIKIKDVIFRLGNIPQLKKDIDAYVNEQWLPWSEEEKPRRETIKLYDSLFSLQQNIEAQGDEQPNELILGIGIVRWSCKGHKIDYPLLEKPIEIEVDRKDGAILIRPRNIEPTLAISAFFALENPGVDTLLRFSKKYFSELSEDVEFSPYIHESFESVLRQAATHLSESGIYWPDINPNKENREPNKVSESLEISDSWVIFARPRSTTNFVQDIERFQKNLEGSEKLVGYIPNPTKRLITELSDKKPISTSGSICLDGDSPPSSPTLSSHNNQSSELFFPKAFNESQIQIIDRLEENDGVVVQGPPGTGKTHTIANIICHYLATGRSVLVTSKGESALSVLQEQIPEELRSLTISLLANERQGMKQLETAVQLLAALVSQTSVRDLKQDIEASELRVKQIKYEITQIDSEIKEWGLKQLNPVEKQFTGANTGITAMELAQQVINDSGNHGWLPDELGPSEEYVPRFTDSDIAKIRASRRKVGKDIIYVGKNLPQLQDMLDSANIAAIHNDLLTSIEIENNSKNSHIPPLAVSVERSIDRARNLVTPLKQLSELLDHFKKHDWLEQIYNSGIEYTKDDLENSDLFASLLNALSSLIKERQKFVSTFVEIADVSSCIENAKAALENLANGKRAFSIFSFGNKDIKEIIHQVSVDGEKPKNVEQWQIVLDYVMFQDEMRKFIIKWNHAGQELGFPKFTYTYGSLYTEISFVYNLITSAKKITNEWTFLSREVTELFPHGIEVSKLARDKVEIVKTIQAIEFNTSRISLGSQRLKLQDLMVKLTQSDGEISKNIRKFIESTIGNPAYSSDKIIQEWQGLIIELNRLNELSSFLYEIEVIADKISDSGAPIWSSKLKSEPLLGTDDELTPVDWYDTWQWKRCKQYLHAIDGRDQLKRLSNKRSMLDHDLKKTFTELVRLKTNIGLHKSMTERVQGALMRFLSSLAKIGKGTGKRAPRHRKDAYRAMQDCYGGVPCWIMPTWRVSESLPSDFGSFDLVIIDEASQSDITALPAILRAKKLLIVGDDKQVSPTAAFIAEEKILQLKHNFLKDQPFSELLLPGVSIYDLANATFPGQRIMLTEHFRCVEPIIRFSMQFYNEPLIPLRIPKSSEKLTPPLIDVFVKGGCRDERKKINELEAEAIISEIQTLVSDPKFNGRSIGVISLLGNEQAKYIQDKLLTTLGEDVYQDYQMACGDAATFQGKERDIIFLSMVDSYNPIKAKSTGSPATKREAEQRFNVALSRARDRMYLYRSLQEENLTNESDLRLKILRHFLAPMPQYERIGNSIDLCDSDFERDVYKRLVEKGYNITPQVRVGAFSIDLVVEGENDRRLAIELDGDKYHPPEKWMEDWKRQRTMERVGWQFWRCWGSSYTIDPEGCIDDLVSVLNSMQILPCKRAASANIYTEQRTYEIENNLLDLS
ncbi:AAA domain-containing protein [Nitrosomonas oligotropha]|uniref:AAA domain-containing protein n=1 Tax=Nitrosomonas oligotropha TaxID=42354 RepID=A0A1H8UCM5_9PROT|nr:AAA domain-containing protein [Nitrosomonas oligotropha]SDX43319.1 AAA domain-containing protein [Nitrosomonas oligotropha]SEP00777.1 AAA domain-containing protein [Nitrosomonas oligotropha]